MNLGLGLWTMRSTASFPAPWTKLYAELREDARIAEDLGFHSLWIAEHHFWYDGWTPAPLVAAATALAATTRLHVGSGIHILPLYDPAHTARQLLALNRLSQGRFEHGVGLGYRASEYDGYGLSRKVRGNRMDRALEQLAGRAEGMPPIWVGGFAEKAVQRAGRLGLGLMLPSTLKRPQMVAAIDAAKAAAEAAGRSVRIGLMKYTWATDGSQRERTWAEDMLGAFTREYSGTWFPIKGRPGFEDPALLDAQMRRSAETALIGSPDDILAELAEYAAVGVELCVLHLIGDGRLPQRHAAMAQLAETLIPALSEPVPA
jgi:alkanesulfonate monooxygenase SsuD/methylene tetrahydromethanopterin reductase-like flavin-dependent oxidoreductase (luciferase family)